jgi:hypothetical protein
MLWILKVHSLPYLSIYLSIYVLSISIYIYLYNLSICAVRHIDCCIGLQQHLWLNRPTEVRLGTKFSDLRSNGPLVHPPPPPTFFHSLLTTIFPLCGGDGRDGSPAGGEGRNRRLEREKQSRGSTKCWWWGGEVGMERGAGWGAPHTRPDVSAEKSHHEQLRGTQRRSGKKALWARSCKKALWARAKEA